MPKEEEEKKTAKIVEIEKRLQELEKYKKGIEMLINANAGGKFFSSDKIEKAQQTLVEMDAAIQLCKARLGHVPLKCN